MMKFEAKKDLEYIVIFWVVMFALLGTMIYAVLFDESLSSKIIGCSLITCIIFVSVIFWFNTYYVISDGHLIVQYGFIKKKIPINSIKSISRTKTLLAGPAFTINKILISYHQGNGLIFVGPENEKVFINRLIEVSKNTIQVDI